MKLPMRPAASPSGHKRRDEVGDLEPALAPHAREHPHRDEHAEEAAVEAHAALPDREDLERMRGVIERLVEEHVAQAPAEDHAEHAVEQHVVDVARMPAGEQVAPRAILPSTMTSTNASEVHEPVPAHGDRADAERDRIELRVNEHAGALQNRCDYKSRVRSAFREGLPMASNRRSRLITQGIARSPEPRDAARRRLRRRRFRRSRSSASPTATAR